MRERSVNRAHEAYARKERPLVLILDDMKARSYSPEAGSPMRRTPSDIPTGIRTERMHERSGRRSASGTLRLGVHVVKLLTAARGRENARIRTAARRRWSYCARVSKSSISRGCLETI